MVILDAISMPVKHIKKMVGTVQAKIPATKDMRLVGIAVVVIVIIAIALMMMQAPAPAVAATPTPVAATPTPEATVAATPTPVAGTPAPSVYVQPPGGQVTEKPHCTDGTPEGQCNAVSYMYCRQAPVGLTVDCTKCGCPSGMTCNSESKTCRS